MIFTNETPVMNSTQPKCEYGFDVEYHPILMVIAVLIIISNMFVIVLFVTKEKLRKGGKLLLLSLAISDVTTGLLTIPLNIGCEVTYSLRLCASSALLNRFIAISTIYHILAITFETYYAILWPMEHRVKIEKRKVLGTALIIWFGALVVAVTPLTWTIGDLTDVRERPSKDILHKMSIYEIFVFLFGFVFPLILIIFAHVRMFLKIIRTRKSPGHRSTNTNNPNRCKAAILFAVMVLVFTVCWLFWLVVSLLHAVEGMRRPFPMWALSISAIIRYSTSFINPLLYTFFRPDFYTAFKTLFCRRTRRTSQPNTAPKMYVNTQQSVSSNLLENDTKV